MTELVLHIGDPKTGTTSLQQAFWTGAVRPPPGRLTYWREANAYELAQPFLKRGKSLDVYRRLADWLAGATADMALVSAERFAAVPPRKLRAALETHVPDALPGLRVIAYVRPHPGRFLASFTQRVKEGRHLGDLDALYDRLNAAPAMNAAPRFAGWADTFPRFTLRPFVPEALVEGDIVRDFLSLVDPGGTFARGPVPRVNEGMTVPALAGLRHLHDRLAAGGVETAIRQSIGSAIGHHPVPAPGGKPWLPRRLAQILAHDFAADARALDARFFGAGAPMADALERAAETAPDREIDLDPAAHFDAADIARLDTLARRLIALRDGPLAVWPFHHRATTRQRTLPKGRAAAVARHRAALREIDGMLAEAAAIVKAGGARGAA